MKRLKKNKNKVGKWTVLPFLALLTYIFTEILSKKPAFTESFYSQKIYPEVAKILSAFSSVFPFSLDDLFYLFLIISGIFLFILVLIRKIKALKALKITVNTISVGYILFYFLWGFNYFRQPINQKLQLREQKATSADFIKILENRIEKTNQSYCTFENFNKSEIDSLIEVSYKKLAPALQIKYPAGKRKGKNITASRFFAKAGISGYFGPFFNEVHVNSYNQPINYPFVLAHEKAHQFGITSEAEANFYAWLVCTQSNSKELQYSANFHVLRFFLFQAYQIQEYPEIITNLNKNVKADYQQNREYWDNLSNKQVDKIATKANDTYLKTNKVEKGIEDYSGVVKFVIDFSLDSTFLQQYNLLPN